MKIVTWNINGIRARKTSLLEWLEKHQPDIAVLEELKAPEEAIPAEILALEGYAKFWNGSTYKKGYSGVGLLVKEELRRNCSFGIPDFDLENRTVALHLSNLTLIGSYVPRGDGEAHYAVKLGYLDNLRHYIESLLRQGRDVVHTGDINVAHTDLDVHHSQNKPGATGLRDEERGAIDRLLETGLHDIMREHHPERKDLFTWWPYWKGARERNLGWRIDCFYLSERLLGHVSDISIDLDEKSSDHAPVILDLGISAD